MSPQAAAGTDTAADAPIAVRLNVSTVTQYLSARSLLADSLQGIGKRCVVLLRSVPEWDGPTEPVWDGGRTARIATAPSPLAVHELVLDHLADEAEGSEGSAEEAGEAPKGPAVLVVLTDREETELDKGILARAYKKRVVTVDSWDVVREAFGAGDVESRLKKEGWAAEALLEAAPGRWPPLVGQLLTRRTALASLALRRLRLGRYGDGAERLGRTAGGDSLDAHTLLGWSLTPGGPERFLALRSPERRGLRDFLSEEALAGPTGRALLWLVEAEHGADATAFGLVCAALWVHVEPDADTYRARGRAERWFGEEPPATGDRLDALVTAFGRSAEEYVGTLLTAATLGTEEAREARRVTDTVLDQASVLARQFGAEAAARSSPVLRAGLEARFAAVGRALAARRLPAVAEAVRALETHQGTGLPGARTRVERACMGQRLAQWLAGDPADESPTVAAAVERQVAETGWVDWAREHIEAGGDPEPELKAAYDTLCARVRELRMAMDRNFARALATWTAAGTSAGSMLTVEDFLDRVVKPVVRQGGGDGSAGSARSGGGNRDSGGGAGHRVLLLVLDGMSAAIADELSEELRRSWAEFDPVGDGRPHRRAMAAALPTVTAVSRTSLFAGRLVKGTQADEKRLFPAQALWGGAPAAVFHKDDLRAETSGETFGSDLTRALADEHTHVAVVLNAIDDRLAKEQKLGDGTWRVEHVPGLGDLLRAAASQGMAVLITSDHGHVVDRHGGQDTRVETETPESARHRVPGGAVLGTEVALAGPRVVWPEPGASIVALWDADARYTALKAGYHGGAALAEFTIPVLAFLPFGAEPPKGWRELGDQRPAWWLLDEQPYERPDAVGGLVRSQQATPSQGARSSQPSPSSQPREASKPSKVSKTQAELAEAHDPLFEIPRTPVSERPAGLGASASPAAIEASESSERAAPHEELLAALLASQPYQDQLNLLARKPPGTRHEKAILALLDAGGTLPVTALAQRVGVAAGRAPGFAAVLRQLLNFDGVQVLETLPDGRTLRLHRGLLREQFGLG